MNNGILLDIQNLSKSFSVSAGLFSRHREKILAVNDVSLTIGRAETVGLVGESGCGKSTLARLMLRLLEPDCGTVALDGRNIFDFSRGEMLSFRRRVQIIFQDPLSSLNPRMTIGRIIGEPLLIHKIVPRSAMRDRINELLGMVGLQPDAAARYPHEFSSGQRQRIGIARALSLNPECIIADEPVSALDVSIQAQTINLLADLQERFRLTYVFISHDLSVVRHLCSRVAVMYAGRIVEIAPREELYTAPLHPYTEALLSAVPVPDPSYKRQRTVLNGEPPGLFRQQPGCVFAARCPIIRRDACTERQPELEEKSAGHWAACFVR